MSTFTQTATVTEATSSTTPPGGDAWLPAATNLNLPNGPKTAPPALPPAIALQQQAQSANAWGRWSPLYPGTGAAVSGNVPLNTLGEPQWHLMDPPVEPWQIPVNHVQQPFIPQTLPVVAEHHLAPPSGAQNLGELWRTSSTTNGT